MTAAVQELGQRFEIAAPALVEARALQQRVDRKFLLALESLPQLFDGLENQYARLDAGGEAWARYRNVYFDTCERRLFHAHRRGVRPRHKVRIREHVDRALAFLEVKRKGTDGRTHKRRLDLSCPQRAHGERERQFVRQHTLLDPGTLILSVANTFRRLTLVGLASEERITIDSDLEFSMDARTTGIRRAVIVEVKQARRGHGSPILRGLRAIHAQEIGVSKYCVGTMLLTPVRANVFLPALKALWRISA